MTTPEAELLKFLVTKLHNEKSDEQIAKLASVTPEEVAATLTSLGITRTTKNRTGKEEARQYIASMSPDEKRAFFKEIDPYKLWTMAEGAPETKIDVSTEPIRIDIYPQLLKVYGPKHVDATVLGDSEEGRLADGSGK